MYYYTTEPIPLEEIPAYFFDEQGNFVYPETYTPEEIANFPEDFMPQTDLHLRWISTIKGNLDSIFRKKTDVYVAGDIYWYMDEMQPTLRASPDVMVAFGRPRQERSTYKQWEEEDIAPQVVFEILSKSNTKKEMKDKLALYEKYGVQEYYLYNPVNNQFYAWLRDEISDRLCIELVMPDLVSPLLGIRLEIQSDALHIYRPEGIEFVTFVQQDEINEAVQEELCQERLAKAAAQALAEQERLAKAAAQALAEQERLAKEEAQLLAEQERLAKEEAQTRAREERAEKLRGRQEFENAKEEEHKTQLENEELRKVLAKLGYQLTN